jgi:hypothetical protein
MKNLVSREAYDLEELDYGKRLPIFMGVFGFVLGEISWSGKKARFVVPEAAQTLRKIESFIETGRLFPN